MTAHAHRWRLEEPNGPTCRGRCLHCGEERTWKTAPAERSYAEWDEGRKTRGPGINLVPGEGWYWR